MKIRHMEKKTTLIQYVNPGEVFLIVDNEGGSAIENEIYLKLDNGDFCDFYGGYYQWEHNETAQVELVNAIVEMEG